jgi:hypothetical protein
MIEPARADELEARVALCAAIRLWLDVDRTEVMTGWQETDVYESSTGTGEQPEHLVRADELLGPDLQHPVGREQLGEPLYLARIPQILIGGQQVRDTDPDLVGEHEY